MKKRALPTGLLLSLPKTIKQLTRYSGYYREGSFKNKIVRVAAGIGLAATEEALCLYYLLCSGSHRLTVQDKAMIIGALGYFVMPIDLIPDFILAAVGFSDDVAVIMLVLNALEKKITPDIRMLAHNKACALFRCSDTLPDMPAEADLYTETEADNYPLQEPPSSF